MPKLIISIDTSNDAFNNPEAELSGIIARLDHQFQNNGIESDFKIYDTNGNPVGACRYDPSDNPPASSLVIEIDTGNDAFNNPEAEMSAILTQIDRRFQNSGIESDFKIYDTNGNSVGMCRFSAGASAPSFK